MIKDHLEYTKLKEFRDTDGRWLIIVIQIKNIEYLIATYYGPNHDKIEHITTMLDKIDNLEVPNVLIGGDFNFTFNPTIDKMGGNNTTNYKCRDTVKGWMNHNNITDVWRSRNPTKRKYTWVSNTKPPIFCILDFFLASDTLTNKVIDCRITQ